MALRQRRKLSSIPGGSQNRGQQIPVPFEDLKDAREFRLHRQKPLILHPRIADHQRSIFDVEAFDGIPNLKNQAFPGGETRLDPMRGEFRIRKVEHAFDPSPRGSFSPLPGRSDNHCIFVRLMPGPVQNDVRSPTRRRPKRDQRLEKEGRRIGLRVGRERLDEFADKTVKSPFSQGRKKNVPSFTNRHSIRRYLTLALL